MRGIGASIGIAVVSWLLVQQGQTHWATLANHLSPFNPAVPPYLAALGLDVQSPSTMALILLEIARQAQMQAFNDLFWFIGWATFAILPLVFIMTRSARKGLIVA